MWQICCDGAPAMLDKKSGFAALVKRHSLQVEVVDCCMHLHALASKTLPTCVQNLCTEIGVKYGVLLFHSHVRFLSKGHVLNRVFELRKEVRKEDMAKHFSDPKFNIALAYLSDIFGKLKDVNLTIQGPKVTDFKTDELKDKLSLEKRE